jgi:hypothetical protein
MFSKSQHLPIVEFKNQKKPSVKDFWQTGYIKKVIGYSNMPLNNKNMHETLSQFTSLYGTFENLITLGRTGHPRVGGRLETTAISS